MSVDVRMTIIGEKEAHPAFSTASTKINDGRNYN